jgi:hypothetical protein
VILTIDQLLRGNREVATYYQKAAARWEEVLGRPGARDPDALAGMLHLEQPWFEGDCEGHFRLGQEIMALAGILRFYDAGPGFQGHEGDVNLVRLAIARSGCSLEVKFAARKIAEYYGLPALPAHEDR